jgi:hypothetical protein
LFTFAAVEFYFQAATSRLHAGGNIHGRRTAGPTELPSISLMSQPDNEAVAAPDLYVVIVKQTFCIGDGFAIVSANHLLKPQEVIVIPDDISPVLCHMPIFRIVRLTGRRS